jgi:5-formyltetrahydrofolate cyclo-ligase
MNKHAMREEARARLAGTDEEERRRASAAVAQRVWEVDEVASARVLLLYASLGPEVDTDPIAVEAVRRGIVVTYPRCLPETRAMVLHRTGDTGELRRGAFGIREPDSACPVVDAGEVDAALVPGLAWDRRGTRLGRGKGYYDRLFLNPLWRGFRCGLFFAVQEFDRLVSNRLDAPLDAVVTESEIARFGRSANVASR